MKAWTLEDRAHFGTTMAGFWQAWSRVPAATQALYVERLESHQMPAVQRALREVKARQEFDRVPGLQVILAEVSAQERRTNWKAAKASGGAFRSAAEADLAKLADACVEIRDAKGASWRFLHLEDANTGVHDFGLDDAVANRYIPWNVLPEAQQDRLRQEGLQELYRRPQSPGGSYVAVGDQDTCQEALAGPPDDDLGHSEEW